MKKLVSVIIAVMMILCCAVAEMPVAEIEIAPSFEGNYAEVDQTYGLVVYVPADWEEYEESEDYLFAYGNDDMDMVTYILDTDIDSFLATCSADEEFTGFMIASINGTTWLLFSSVDDLANYAVITYEEGSILVIEFDTEAPMGDSTLPVEILGSLTTVAALAA